jgi:type IV pilus assembly protein PilM
MAEQRAVWGIEVGQYALKAIKLQYAEAAEQVVASAFEYVPFPKILSQPDAIPEELIPQALDTFLSRNDVSGDLIAISVPGHSALVRFIQLPPVEANKVAEIVKYEARQQIPFALEEVIWDYQSLGSGVEESGYMLDAEVGLFAMKRDQVMQALRPFTNAKVEVELIQIAPLALYNVLTYDELGFRPGEPKPAGDEYTILLDMGCDNTTLLVSNGSKIWVRNVPIGGNHFTRALTKEMKLSFAKAEHLKCNATKSPDPRAVFQALRPVFNEYVSEIQRSIGYFSSVNRQAKINKVIGFGNGFKLAGLQKFLQQNLQYEVERPDSFNALAGDAVLNAPLFQENVLGFAVPYGLALQVLDQTSIKTTLLPPEIASARRIRRKKPWAVATAAALLAGTSLSMIGHGITYSAVNTDEWNAAVGEAESFGGTVGGYKSAYDTELGRLETLKQEGNDLVAGRRNLLWLELYKSINDTLPRDTGDEQDTVDIQKRHQVSLSSITSEHVADPSEWFTGLSQTGKNSLTSKDSEAAPATSENGNYIFTLKGVHYHHDEEDISTHGPNYIKTKWLPKLQADQVESLTGMQDVGRMGISHACLVSFQQDKTPYYPKGLPQPGAGSEAEERRVRLGAGNRPQLGGRGFGGAGFGGGGLGNPAAMSGRGNTPANPEDVQMIERTSFVVQFHWTPIPADERVDEAAAGEEGAEDAAAGEAATPAAG